MPVVLALPPDLRANSYVDLAYAEQYISTYVLGTDALTAWLAKSADEQSKLLILATRQLDSYVCWKGRKTLYEQDLQWPRYYVWIDGYIIDSTTVPKPVMDATVMVALWLDANTGEDQQSTEGLYKQIQVGPIKIQYDQANTGEATRYLPNDVIALLERFGEYDLPYTGSGLRTVRISR